MDRKIKSILDKYQREKGQLVSILQDIQAEDNYLTKEALTQVSEGLEIPLSEVYSVATFFKAFSLKPRGRYLISVCLGTACYIRGARRVLQEIEKRLGIRPGETTDDGEFSLETINCPGACSLGPMVVINGDYFGRVTAEGVDSILEEYDYLLWSARREESKEPR